MPDLEFKPTHKFFRVTKASIKYTKNTNSDIFSLHVYNNSLFKITLPLELLGYCETNATNSPTIEIACRVKNILNFLDICQSTILNEESSNKNIVSDKNGTRTFFTKLP